MNIKDEPYIPINNALFIDKEGLIIPGDFHAKYASQFYGIDVTMDREEALKNQWRMEIYERYKDLGGRGTMIDFMIQYFGFDKCCYNAIITSRPVRYEYYFNHFIEGIDLLYMTPIIEQDGAFRFLYPTSEERDNNLSFQKEGQVIIDSVPLRERKLHYK